MKSEEGLKEAQDVPVLLRRIALIEADRKALFEALWIVRDRIVKDAFLVAEIRAVEGGEHVLEQLEDAVDGKSGDVIWKRYQILEEIATALTEDEAASHTMRNLLECLRKATFCEESQGKGETA